MDTTAVRVLWAYQRGDPRTHARSLLRHAAAALVSAPAADVLIGRSPHGAPVLSGAADGLRGSISHTSGLVAVAVATPGTAPVGVGVDVEAVRALDAVAFADRWFARDESRWVRSLPPELRVLGVLSLWTRKEAAGKALGVGLAAGGQRRDMGVPGPPPALPAPSTRLLPLATAPQVAVGVLPAPPGFVLAAAYATVAGGVAPAVAVRLTGPAPRSGPAAGPPLLALPSEGILLDEHHR
jgi:4'-phosphopantetheinyl transferase